MNGATNVPDANFAVIIDSLQSPPSQTVFLSGAGGLTTLGPWTPAPSPLPSPIASPFSQAYTVLAADVAALHSQTSYSVMYQQGTPGPCNPPITAGSFTTK
jgi:hypothetical protein